MKPRFAALLCNYNDSAQLPETLRAILGQTVPFDEIIIIDDASTDDSIVLIESLIADVPQARLYRNEHNLGIVASYNKGFGLATSDYVHAFSANDVYYSTIVEHGHRMAELFPGVAMISANASVYDAVHNIPAPDMIMRLPQREMFVSPSEYRARNKVAPVSMNGGANSIRRDIYQTLGGQDAGLAWYADWFLYFFIGLVHGFAYVPEIYTMCRLEGKKSFSSERLDWQRQKPVLLHMLQILKDRYPSQAPLFRETALLPAYNLRILSMVLANHRWFITPLFLWRCIGHQVGFWLKHYLPRPLLMRLRSLVRL